MASNLEVRLSFKPLLEGLNRFGSAIEKRMERVRAFNVSLGQGAQQANQLLAGAAAALSGAAIARSFGNIITGGVQFNATLQQAELGIAAVLKQFDTVGKFATFDDAIDESRRAIDSLKAAAVDSPASFDSLVQAFQATAGPMTAANIAMGDQIKLIVNMSQALAGLGIREEQILQETRALITGNINADAEAAKILGITSADITAAKAQGNLYEFLASKISSFAEAGERGKTTFATLKSNFGDALTQRAADATVNLTNALSGLFAKLTDLVQTRAFADLLSTIANRGAELVGTLTQLTAWFSTLGPNAQQTLSSIASGLSSVGSSLLLLLVPMLALRGLVGVVNQASIPLRQFFVFATGMKISALASDLNAYVREWGLLTTIKISSWAQRAVIGLGLVGAAFAGWQLGTFMNELHLGGMQIKDWAAIVVNSVIGLLEALAIWKDVLKAKAIATATEGIARLKILYWQGAVEIVEGLNVVLGKFGKALPTDGLREAVLAARVELAKLKTDSAEGIAALEAAMARVLSLRGELGDDLGVDGVGGGVELNPRGGGSDAAAAAAQRALTAAEKLAIEEQRQLRLKRLLFDLDTAILEAQAAGQQEQVDQLTRTRDKQQLLVDLGTESLALINARLDVEQELALQERARVADEMEFARELGDRERERAEIEANRYITAEEKQRLILPLLEQENQLIRTRIGLMEEELLLGATDERRAQLQQKIDELRSQQAGNAGEQTANAPQTLGQGMLEGTIGVLDQIGTKAQQVARGMQTVWQSAIGNIQGGLYKMITGTISLGDGLKGIAIGFGQSMLQAFTQMLAEYAVKRAAMFVLDKIFNAASTAATVATSSAAAAALAVAWAPAAIAASIATLGSAAVAGSAAYAAAIAGGTAVTASFSVATSAAAIGSSIPGNANGGMITGPGTGTSDSILRRLSDGEFVQPAAAVSFYGADFMESIRNRSFNPAGAVASGLTQPRANAGGGGSGYGGGNGGGGDPREMMEAFAGKIQIVPVYSTPEAQKIKRNGEARGDIVIIVEQEFGIKRRS